MRPAVPSPFAWAGEHLEIALPGGRARFTTRRGGVSTGPYASLNLGRRTDDDPAAVAENYARLDVGRVAQPDQVHGTVVLHLPEPAAAVTPGDGVIVTDPGLAALVLTADCLPVALIADGAVAMVHAGWKGLDGGVLEAGVAAMGHRVAGPVRAAIGPGAGACCYEVGPELHARFGVPGPTLDLKGIARARLLAAGVAEVHDTGLCTLCSPPELFFSHRRDGGVTGRQAGLAWRS